MGAKKNPGRFTLQFNPGDPSQQIAADVLERQGRHKAQFITNAILQYVHASGEKPAVSIEPGELEAMILKILKAQGVPQIVPLEQTQQAPYREQDTTEYAPCVDRELEQVFGTADMSAIANTLSAFQQK